MKTALLILLSLLAAISCTFAGISNADSIRSDLGVLCINDMELWFRNDGGTGWTSGSNFNFGGYYPAGVNFLYTDGIVWGGKVYDGQTEILRVGGQGFRVGTDPGPITPPGITLPWEKKRVYRIRPDYLTADLRDDAAHVFRISLEKVTKEQIEAVRARYNQDWQEWPVDRGAPYCDNNSNGMYDEGDTPGLPGAGQVIWFDFNDLDRNRTKSSFNSEPIGFEAQVTVWGYNRPSPLWNVVLKKVRIIYKGLPTSLPDSRIDSMYIAQWSDPDLGDAVDDLVGCDTTRQMGYVYNYNADDKLFKKYNLVPPAVGYVLLQGPIVAGNPGDKAIFNFAERTGFKNLPLSSFIYIIPELPFDLPPDPKPIFWKMLRGFQPTRFGPEIPYRTPPDLPPTKFLLTGDPVKKTGFIGGLDADWSPPPTDIKLCMSTGPFSVALHDTQEVVIAYVGGVGPDRLSSITAMRFYADIVRQWYPDIGLLAYFGESKPDKIVEKPAEYLLYQNYPNPFNPSTKITYTLPRDTEVKLAVFDILGREVKILDEGLKATGRYDITWDGTDKNGHEVPSGVYIYRWQVGATQLVRKMVIVR